MLSYHYCLPPTYHLYSNSPTLQKDLAEAFAILRSKLSSLGPTADIDNSTRATP